VSLNFPSSRLLGLTLAASAFVTGLVQAETLSVVDFGGAYEEAAKHAYFNPFTEKTRHDFTFESYDGGIAKLQAMVQAKNTTWDLIDLETNDAIRACDEGLLQKFDASRLGDTRDFLPGSIL
jgi:putative spermidine/putrescine transport system substrate-binding protein